MLNKVILMGRLTAVPELKKTPGDISVCSFTVAVDRDFKNDAGERQADFIPCVAWREKADFICKYFGKGAMVAVCGRLESRQYETKEGQKRTAYEVVCEQISFTGEKKEEGKRSGEPAPSYPGFEPPAGRRREPEPPEPSDEDFASYDPEDDLPF